MNTLKKYIETLRSESLTDKEKSYLAISLTRDHIEELLKDKVDLAIIGSRGYEAPITDIDIILDTLNLACIDINTIISGGARGADKAGEAYARYFHIETRIFLADWKEYGKAAGFIRNRTIINKCNIVLSLWDGESKGTRHAMNIAVHQNKLVIVYNYTSKLFSLHY